MRGVPYGIRHRSAREQRGECARAYGQSGPDPDQEQSLADPVGAETPPAAAAPISLPDAVPRVLPRRNCTPAMTRAAKAPIRKWDRDTARP